MKTQIAPRLKKALLASKSIIALSLTCSPALAEGLNFDKKNVDGNNFERQDLIDSSWEGASAVGADFWGANLTRANFSNANLTDASFAFANLTEANLENAIIQGARFSVIVGNASAANPKHTVTHAMLMSTKSWNDNDLSGVSFDRGDLSGLNFTNFNLSGTNFTGADLTGIVLTNTIIQGASFDSSVGYDSYRSITHEMLKSTKSWRDKDFSGINFNNGDFNGFDFSSFNLTDTGFTYANLQNTDMRNANLNKTNLASASLSGADLRGADMTNAKSFKAVDHNNLILANGKINNLTLSSADETLTIRGGTDTNAFLDGTTAIISGDATLTLTQNAVLELTNNTQLTLADDGHLNLIFDTTDPSSLASIVIKSDSSLTLDPSAILDITINDLSVAGFEANILSWADDADVVDLLSRLEDGTAYRINGHTLRELGLYAVIDHDNNTFSIIPEPSTATLSLFALAGLLARRRRKAAQVAHSCISFHKIETRVIF